MKLSNKYLLEMKLKTPLVSLEFDYRSYFISFFDNDILEYYHKIYTYEEPGDFRRYLFKNKEIADDDSYKYGLSRTELNFRAWPDDLAKEDYLTKELIK